MVSRYIRSNILGLIAIFIALGGTAVALPGENTVDSRDIQNGQVKGVDVAEPTLGIVPNADRLDGLNSNAFARTRTAGRSNGSSGVLAQGEDITFTVAGGTFTYTCMVDTDPRGLYSWSSPNPTHVWVDDNFGEASFSETSTISGDMGGETNPNQHFMFAFGSSAAASPAVVDLYSGRTGNACSFIYSVVEYRV